MNNEIIAGKLTPYDAELFLMCESLTGKTIEPCVGGADEYFIVVDYSEHPQPDYVNAVMDAVAGRVGERLVEMNDEPENHRFIAHIKFSDQKYPRTTGMATLAKCDFLAGDLFVDDFGNECHALQVKRDYPARLQAFVGSGEMQISETDCEFAFINADSVYQYAKEFDYIVYVKPGRFSIVKPEEFENNFVKK